MIATCSKCSHSAHAEPCAEHDHHNERCNCRHPMTDTKEPVVTREHREAAALTMFPGTAPGTLMWHWVESGDDGEDNWSPVARVARLLATREALAEQRGYERASAEIDALAKALYRWQSTQQAGDVCWPQYRDGGEVRIYASRCPGTTPAMAGSVSFLRAASGLAQLLGLLPTTKTETACRACGNGLAIGCEVADGCPCNSPRGINHGLVPRRICTCAACDLEQTGSARNEATQQAQEFLCRTEKRHQAQVAAQQPPAIPEEWSKP